MEPADQFYGDRCYIAADLEGQWPNSARWTSLYELNQHMLWGTEGAKTGYHSDVYRHFVEEHLDAYRQSREFADLLRAPATRAVTGPAGAAQLMGQIEAALQANRLDVADATLLEFRDRAPRLGTRKSARPAALGRRLAGRNPVLRSRKTLAARA